MLAAFGANSTLAAHHAAAHVLLRAGAQRALEQCGWGFDGSTPVPRIECQVRHMHDLIMGTTGIPRAQDRYAACRQHQYDESFEAIHDATVLANTHPDYSLNLLAAAPSLDS